MQHNLQLLELLRLLLELYRRILERDYFLLHVFVVLLYLLRSYFLFKTILFDLDGTLTDPAEGITNSFIHALKFFGIEIPSYEKLCSFIGPPLPSTFEKEFGFTGEKNDLAVKKYREHFATKGLFENTVYEGIPELLQALKEKGFELIVATSKPEQYSVQILDHFDLSKYFDFICGSNMDES